MSKLGTVLRAVIDATHEIALVRFSWASRESFDCHDFVPLAIGWGSLLFGLYDGRPTLGIQVAFGGLTIWCGPLFRRYGCPACTDEPCIDHVKL